MGWIHRGGGGDAKRSFDTILDPDDQIEGRLSYPKQLASGQIEGHTFFPLTSNSKTKMKLTVCSLNAHINPFTKTRQLTDSVYSEPWCVLL